MKSKHFTTHLDHSTPIPQTVTPAGVSQPAAPARLRGWLVWTPYAAVVWSLAYAALGTFWLANKRGFPFASPPASTEIGPLIARLPHPVIWALVLLAGLPAAMLGIAMLRPSLIRAFRPFFIPAGFLLSAALLLMMTDLNLLTTLAYLPFATFKLLAGDEFGRVFFQGLPRSTLPHQLLCLAGGFLWLAATLSYSRRSNSACLACGRRDSQESWTSQLASPASAARWGRIAVLVALLVPVNYAVTRYAWALGIPLGMSAEQIRSGQQAGTWISGLFLANVGLVGAVLMLGLVMRWGEVFPRWLPGLAGRPVPVALAVIPAAIVSVLLIVGGLAIWANYAWMADVAAAAGQDMGIVVGPVALFPLWGAALAAATLAYTYRRRGPCRVCGRGASLS